MTAHAIPLTPPVADVADPIIAAIATLRTSNAALEAIPTSEYHRYGGEDVLAELMLFRHQRVLDEWDRPAKTREGAIAALRYAQCEIAAFGESPAANAMIKAALGYLERH